DVVITGAGAREVRLKPGRYKVEASKDGKVVRQELVTVHRNDRQVVRISKEVGPAAGAASADADWERSVAALPAEQPGEAGTRRPREHNPHFCRAVEPTIRDGAVTGLRFNTDYVADLSPVRALTRLGRSNATVRLSAGGLSPTCRPSAGCRCGGSFSRTTMWS